MADGWDPPTRDGVSSGIDSVSGMAWSVEPAEAHWADHDRRQVAYWRSRPADERLAQARWYRQRVHGVVEAPGRWTWTLVPAHDGR